MTKNDDRQEGRNQSAYWRGRANLPDPSVSNPQETYWQKKGAEHSAEQAKQLSDSIAKNSSPVQSALFILCMLAPIGFIAIKARDDMSAQRETRARVAVPAAATHYFNNEGATFFYATGSRRGQPAPPKLFVKREGRCYDLRNVPQRTGTVTIDVPNYLGEVFRVYTDESNFSRLPNGAICNSSGHYRVQ